ncbi:MAG: hypothetical protein Q8K31_05725 [Burkholderiaceae bacterium]|nr:hypothetical protein [Burkholderiaceae bacterium]
MKIFVFLHADESANRDEFQRHCLAVEGPRLLGEFPQMRNLTMNLVIDRPEVVQPRPYELLSPFRRCEVIVTALFEDEAAARDFVARATFRAKLAEFVAVSGKTIFGEPRVTAAVGIMSFGRVQFHPDLPESAIMRSWALHAELVREVLPHAIYYVQNFGLPNPGQPEQIATGVAELAFPSATVSSWSNSANEKRLVHDLGHFVKSSCRHHAIAHVLR